MAVLRLSTNSNLVGTQTGRSPGFVALEDAAGIEADMAKRIIRAELIYIKAHAINPVWILMVRGDCIRGVLLATLVGRGLYAR